MTKWKYHLQSGLLLRDAINDDENKKTLIALKKCYEEINSLIPEIYDEEKLLKISEEIENQLDNCDNYEEYEMTETDVQDAINYLLSQFYDFCDYNRIWINLF